MTIEKLRERFNEIARQFAIFGFLPHDSLAKRHGAWEQTFCRNESDKIRVACTQSDPAEFQIAKINFRVYVEHCDFSTLIPKIVKCLDGGKK